MKKILSILLAAALLMLCVGASAMTNPVVEVYDDDSFEHELGIDIDADDLPGWDTRMAIIDDKLGQVVFTLENVNGEMIDWTLRFTRDASFDKDPELFSGVHDAAMTEPETREIDYQDDADDPVIKLTLTSQTAPTEDMDLYFWDHRGVYYSLTVGGGYSQMQFAEVMDRILEACIDD